MENLKKIEIAIKIEAKKIKIGYIVIMEREIKRMEE